MAENLSGLYISESFPRLVQISGSQLADGTGSLLSSLDVDVTSATSATSASYATFAETSNSASFATTASYALNAEQVDTGSLLITASISGVTQTFTKGDGSTFTNTITDATSASFATTAVSSSYATTASFALNAPTLDTGSFVKNDTDSYTSTGKVEHVITLTQAEFNSISASADPNTLYYITDAVASVVSASYALSASHAENASTADSATTATSASYAITASHADNASTSNFATSAGTASLATTATLATSASHAVTASHALISEDLVSTANINISSITASNASFVSASITNLTTITGSIVQVGDAFVLLNTATPTSRYAGLKVEDSGSTPSNFTASFFFDSQTNDWNYEYSGSDPTNFGVAMFGPEYSTKGSPVYPTNNRLLKGNGGHHVQDSSITDDGSIVSFSAELDVTGGVTASAGFLGDLTGNASTATTATSSSFATTASYASNAQSAVSASHSEFATSASYALTSTSASHAVNSDSALTATTASYVAGANVDGTVALATTASFASTIADGITINDPIISGSVNAEVQALAIASNTASMDCSTGNFFTLTLASSATTHLDASNIQAGQTINVKITQPATTGSLTFSSDFAFPTGSEYAGSAVGSAVDLISMVSFDTTKLYANQIENLV